MAPRPALVEWVQSVFWGLGPSSQPQTVSELGERLAGGQVPRHGTAWGGRAESDAGAVLGGLSGLRFGVAWQRRGFSQGLNGGDAGAWRSALPLLLLQPCAVLLPSE